MTRILSIFILWVSLGEVQAFNFLQITNDTLVITWSDSYARAQYGQRQNFFILSDLALMNPGHFLSLRDHSRSGGSNVDVLTNRFPKYGVPEWGATHSKTNGLNILYVSSNGNMSSNVMYPLLVDSVRAPGFTYNTNGVLTNDWSQTTNLFNTVIIGDLASHTATGDPTVYNRNQAGKNVAAANGLAYVESWLNTVGVITNLYASAQNSYWFNPPNYDHPGNELQLMWAMTTVHDLGEDTNAFTAVLDWNTATVTQTNHCVVTSVTQTGNSISFIFTADRMGMGYYAPDDSQTNDCTGAFPLVPALSNYVCEIFRITNFPAGNYNVSEDGVQVASGVSSTRIQGGMNFFTDVHSGARR